MPGTDYVAQISDVDIKWKVSMGVSNNEVKNLNQPLVTLMITTTDQSGNKRNLPIEMTTLKFKELFTTMKQINKNMEHSKML